MIDYHFDSLGNKLNTKWDTFDADAELHRLEEDEQRGETSATCHEASKQAHKKTPLITRSSVLATSKGMEHEFEAVLSFLDDVRGDNEVKQLRKSIASKVTSEYLARVDAIQAIVA